MQALTKVLSGFVFRFKNISGRCVGDGGVVHGGGVVISSCVQ